LTFELKSSRINLKLKMTLGTSSFEVGGNAKVDDSDDSNDLTNQSTTAKSSSDDSDDLYE